MKAPPRTVRGSFSHLHPLKHRIKRQGDVMRRRQKGCGVYLAAVAVGVLIAMLLPVWWCFWIICALLALICFC